MAEVLLPLAHPHVIGTEFDLAAAELDEYSRRYAALGANEIGAANVLKARARLEIMRRGGTALRGLRRSPQAAAPVAAAVRDLRRAARLPAGGFGPGSAAVRRDHDDRRVHRPARRAPVAARPDPLDEAQRHLVRARWPAPPP